MEYYKKVFPDKKHGVICFEEENFLKNLLLCRKHYCFGDDYPNQDKNRSPIQNLLRCALCACNRRIRHYSFLPYPVSYYVQIVCNFCIRSST